MKKTLMAPILLGGIALIAILGYISYTNYIQPQFFASPVKEPPKRIPPPKAPKTARGTQVLYTWKEYQKLYKFQQDLNTVKLYLEYKKEEQMQMYCLQMVMHYNWYVSDMNPKPTPEFFKNPLKFLPQKKPKDMKDQKETTLLPPSSGYLHTHCKYPKKKDP